MMSKNESSISLGDQIRTAREKAGLTQADVAKAASIDVSYYAEIERNAVNPSYRKIQAIAKVLKIKSISVS
jgi:transcriptional regulator with XRE-family HTH domain